MSTDAPEEPAYIVEMLNEFSGKDHVECAIQVEIAGISYFCVVALGLQRFDSGGVDVDPDDIGDFLAEKPVEPVGTPKARRTTDIEQRLPTDQWPYDLEAITQRAFAPWPVTPPRLEEMARA